jgi:small-conductance mechanosensitive channel
VKPSRQTVLLLLLLLVALMGVASTRFWFNLPTQQTSGKSTLTDQSKLVDEQPLVTAQRLATLALIPEEQEFAQESLRLADHELDLTFASALRNATLHPAPPTPAARAILGHIEEIQAQVKPQQDDIARLKSLLPKAQESQKQALEEELQLQEVLLEVAQEELDAAQQELIRVGGDPKSIIERLMEQHEAWHQRQSTGSPSVPSPNTSRLMPEESGSRSAFAQFRAWRQFDAKARELAGAQQEVKSRAAELAQQHQGLEQLATGEQPEKQEPSRQTNGEIQAGSTTAGPGSYTSEVFSILKRVADQQQELAELDKRTGDLQQLENLYGNWNALIQVRKHGYAIGLVEAALWVLIIVFVVLLADPAFRYIFSRFAPESKRLRTLRAVERFAVRAIGIALILLVIFGPPSQLATVLALAGAGLTVALKDFIVGFFGWFALMGRNGIRPGDWVEIEGIGGEVLEVGLLHTVLLETGNWSGAGHPTGRKVTFVNSFAIEKHYFNFSTSGQWLWDEIQVPIPSRVDPYPIAEAVQKMMAEENQANARLAEQEWQRVVPSDLGRSFSAAPTISVQPTSVGVNVIVRYITRAPERHEIRTRLYHKIVEILRMKQIPRAADASTERRQVAGQF